MTHRDKVFAQNWIEQMREDFVSYPFHKYAGRPLTYVYAVHPYTYVNCFWWNAGGSVYPWGRRDNALEQEVFVR